jgi:superfamily II DNA or RNA helicase
MPVSSFPLRYYQRDMVDSIGDSWDAGADDVMPVLPTGSGKTRIMAEFSHRPGLKIYQAHRRELVAQIALAIAKERQPHRVIGDKSMVKFITDQQIEKLGYTTYTPMAENIIVSAQTLHTRPTEAWHAGVKYFFSDEGHHGLRESVWGRNRARFPHAKALWPTATPIRDEGAGLGRDFDGFIDQMIIGPSMRQLINERHLADYDIVMDETDIDLSRVAISAATGDYVEKQLASALKESRICGDTVESYQRYAAGRLTVVFTADVDLAEEQSKQFRDAGIPAEAISSRNSDKERADILRRFEKRQTLVLVNNDLLGEGFDCPEIECVIFDRHTESYRLFVQQWGRALRYVAGKRALIIDKVGNTRKFLARGFPLPDNHHAWSLERRDRKGGAGAGAADGNTMCTNVPDCGFPYPVGLSACPYCGHEPIKTERSGPERVDGDLRLLSPAELEELRRALVSVSQDPNAVRDKMLAAGAPTVAALSAAKQIRMRAEARERLERSINVWAGIHRDLGVSESDAYRIFYTAYGVDTLSALTGTAADMRQLADKLHGVTGI